MHYARVLRGKHLHNNVVTNVNDNATYNLAELNKTRLTVPIAGKQAKILKKWHEDEPNLDEC